MAWHLLDNPIPIHNPFLSTSTIVIVNNQPTPHRHRDPILPFHFIRTARTSTATTLIIINNLTRTIIDTH
jgi:hypothetical protein